MQTDQVLKADFLIKYLEFRKHSPQREERDIHRAFVSNCCCKKWPQIWWLKTTQIHSCTVQGVRSLRWGLGLVSWAPGRQDRLPSEGSRGQWLSVPFQPSRGCLHSLAPGQQSHYFLHHLFWLWPSSLPLSLVKDLCDSTGPTWIIQDNLPISRLLITAAKSFWPLKVIHSGD